MNEQLESIAQEIDQCRQCPLHQERRNTVPGDGPHDAEILIVAEGPGEHEDRQGRPFVGASGNVLKELLDTVGLSRHDVFITNVIKCRAPNNRAPKPAEVAACRPFLERQIEALQPRIVITMGAPALNWFKPGSKISHEQGNVFIHQPGQLVFPVMHPAAGMLSPNQMDTIFAAFPALNHWLDLMRVRPEPRDNPAPPPRPPEALDEDLHDTLDPPPHALPPDGPAHALVAWLEQEAVAIAGEWDQAGDPGLRHRLNVLSQLIAAVRDNVPARERPALRRAINAAIAQGRRASESIPYPCAACRQWFYPATPGAQHRCVTCEEGQFERTQDLEPAGN